MGKKYAVIGKGDAPEKAIKAALADLPEDAEFICHKDGKASDGQTTVWNWLIDNERVFSVYGNNVGKSLQEYAKDCDFGTISTVVEMSDVVLALWDDTDDLEQAILLAASSGKKILELSNGLAPIEVEPDAPVAKEESSPEPTYEKPSKDEDEEEGTGIFSREEMEAMPAAAVKRYAKANNFDISGLTKAEIIDKVFATAHDEWPTEGTVEEDTAAPVVWEKMPEGWHPPMVHPLEQRDSPEELVLVVIHYPTTMISKWVPASQVSHL